MKCYVLMSVYVEDSPRYLKTALASIFGAEGDHILLLGVDGPIGDELAVVLKEYEQRECHRLQVVRFARNGGLARTLNALIDVALRDPDCEFLFRMDSDDICDPRRFVVQREALLGNKSVGVLGSAAEIIDENGVTTGVIRKSADDGSLRRRLPYDAPFIHPTVAVRASVFRSGARYPESTRMFEDVALWSALSVSGVQFSNLPHTLLKYRQTSATYRRRSGYRKALSEISVRLQYLWRTRPWRADVAFLVVLVSLGKIVLPASVMRLLFFFRGRLLQ